MTKIIPDPSQDPTNPICFFNISVIEHDQFNYSVTPPLSAEHGVALGKKYFFSLKKSMLELCNYIHDEHKNTDTKLVGFSIENKQLVSIKMECVDKNLPCTSGTRSAS